MSDFDAALADLRKILEKMNQTHRIYEGLWEERSELYASVFVRIKKGDRGWFRKRPIDFKVDFDRERYRLDILNKREAKVLHAIVTHKDDSLSLMYGILSVMHKNRADRYEEVARHEKALEAMAQVLQEYLGAMHGVHQHFLDKERVFIESPSKESLQEMYCVMQALMRRYQDLHRWYASQTSPFANALSVDAMNRRLLRAIEKGIDEAQGISDIAARRRAQGLLEKATGHLRPYFDRDSRNLLGTFSQRMSFSTTAFPQILVSTVIRIGLITPILFEATKHFFGHIPSIRITPYQQFPQFYVDLYLVIIGILAYNLDVLPGFGKYGIEGPQKVLRLIRARTGTENPLGFACA